MRSSVCLVTLLLCATGGAVAQGRDPDAPTHADSIRGADNPSRSWWDVTFYDLHVRVNPADSSFGGWNGITYRVLRPGQTMQLDLQAPLLLDSVVQDGRRLEARREADAWFVTLPTTRAGRHRTVTAYYHGQPGRGRPGRSNGVIWSRDSLGASWFATSDELPGASIWWPLKDYLGDEPDSQRIAITVPDPLIEVVERTPAPDHAQRRRHDYLRVVRHRADQFLRRRRQRGTVRTLRRHATQGEAGPLTLDFWPLAAHLDTAKAQWPQATPMLACFEGWFGPYPWYADGYKLIETPYLGMEHQSGIAYGNQYLPGYRGRDLSGTGLGLDWDYIVIHESAHEWFGNSISTPGAGDLWIHESLRHLRGGSLRGVPARPHRRRRLPHRAS